MADMSQADESQTDYVALMEKIEAAKKADKVAKKLTKSKKKTLAAVAQYRIGVSALDDAPAVAMSDSDR